METTKMTYINWINAKVAKPFQRRNLSCFLQLQKFYRGLFYFESSPETGIDVFWWTIKPELPEVRDEA